MILGLTSVIVPSYNHAAYVVEAIESALAQTRPVEVVVVDDGSTDETAKVLARYAGRQDVVVDVIVHQGPSAARNRGLDLAKGEFVMLLDADDVIAPDKVERQLREMSPDIGWVMCDVRIEDRIEDRAKGRVELASERYRYADRELGGWIASQLSVGNFIPIMSPLIRASVVAGIRFSDQVIPEDWGFWHQIAAAARVAYVPEVLATYRKKKTGRSRLPATSRSVFPNLELPLRLNLGCGQKDKPSWHPLKGFVNLDKSLGGWCFEDGLPEFADGSVSGITISHALLLLPIEHWPRVFSECARVLRSGGIVRVTDDATDDPRSRTFGKGWQGSEPAVTLTSALLVAHHMEAAGLQVHVVDAKTTHFSDQSLMQAHHGKAPDVFFVEGQRVEGVLFSPHNDDEALFASFVILRHRPRVVVCFESPADYGDPRVREQESRDACAVLGAAGFEQWPGGSLVERMRAYDEQVKPQRVWAPDVRSSHQEHVAVAQAAAEVFGSRLTTFHTYDWDGRVREGREIHFEPAWVYLKLRALLQYETQARHPRAHKFFLDDQHEFYGRLSG